MDSERARQHFLVFELEFENGKLKAIRIRIGWPAVAAALLLARGAAWIAAVGPLLGHLK